MFFCEKGFSQISMLAKIVPDCNAAVMFGKGETASSGGGKTERQMKPASKEIMMTTDNGI